MSSWQCRVLAWEAHEPAHKLWIDLLALVELLEVGFADLSEVRSRPPIVEYAVGEDLRGAMGENLILVPEVAQVWGSPSMSKEANVALSELDVGEGRGVSGGFPHEDSEVLAIGVNPHLPDGDLDDSLTWDELAEQGLSQGPVCEGDALRDDGIAEHACLPVGAHILGESPRRVGPGDDTWDGFMRPVPAHAPLAEWGRHEPVPDGHEVEASVEVGCPDIGSGEDAPADSEPAAEELVEEGALGVRGSGVVGLDLTQTSGAEGVAVLEDDALDAGTLVARRKT